MPQFVPVEGDPFAGDWREQEARENLAAQQAAPQSRSWADTARDVLSAPYRAAKSVAQAFTLTPVEHDPFTEDPYSEHLPTPGWLDKAVTGAVGAVGDAAMIPERAIKGSATDLRTMGSGRPMQSVGPAADAAMLLGGAAPLTAEEGAAGIFGGRLMRNADPEKYARAEQLEKSGVHPAEIFYSTGLARGADREWRQEIDDSESSLRFTPKWGLKVDTKEGQPRRVILNPGGHLLEDIYKHQDLFEAYPFLKTAFIDPLPKEIEDQGVLGQKTKGRTIQMSSRLTPEEFKSVLLHEIQHIVQQEERFAPGDNMLNHIPPAVELEEEKFIEMRKESEADIRKKLFVTVNDIAHMKNIIRGKLNWVPTDYVKTLQPLLDAHPEIKERLGNIAKVEDMLYEAKDKAFTKYQRAMGEVESRNVQKRMNFSKDQRGVTSPVSTEAVPRFLQRDPRVFREHQNNRPTTSVENPKLTLEPKGKAGIRFGYGGVHNPDLFVLHDSQGAVVGELKIVLLDEGRKVYIDDIRGTGGRGPRDFGAEAMRDVYRQIQAVYPNAEEIGGTRVSGARQKAKSVTQAWVSATPKLIAVDHDPFK